MLAMNRIRGWLRLKNVIPLFIALVVASGVFLTAQLASGDPPLPPPDIDSVTPPPQPVDAIPEPPALPADAGVAPEPLIVAGVEIPVPPGAHIALNTSHGGGGYKVILGNSRVFFDDQGTIISARISPEDAAAFEPVLGALAQLSSTAR